jgi:hypothetical protein
MDRLNMTCAHTSQRVHPSDFFVRFVTLTIVSRGDSGAVDGSALLVCVDTPCLLVHLQKQVSEVHAQTAARGLDRGVRAWEWVWQTYVV